jgi:hypothetical protein
MSTDSSYPPPLQTMVDSIVENPRSVQTDSPDTAHSQIVRDHPFEPKDPAQPWSLCAYCNLAQSTHIETLVPFTTNAPAAVPPRDLPPGARLVEKGEPEPEEELPPSTGAEVHLAAAEEHMENSCWNCGGKERQVGKLQKLESGTVLCQACIQIMKPGM